MKIAVTDHAVDRYRERVPGSKPLTDDAIRELIRDFVTNALEDGNVQPHPGYPERRIVPFQVGKDFLYLALGPNKTNYPGEWAVIGTLNDREGGKTTTGATLADVVSEEVKAKVAKFTPQKPQYLVRVSSSSAQRDNTELYEAKDDADLTDLLTRRSPDPDLVEVFERKQLTIKRVYTVEKK